MEGYDVKHKDEKCIILEVFVIKNDKNEYLCKKYNGKLYFAKNEDTDISSVKYYKTKSSATKLLEDTHYWEHRGFDPEKLQVNSNTITFIEGHVQ